MFWCFMEILRPIFPSAFFFSHWKACGRLVAWRGSGGGLMSGELCTGFKLMGTFASYASTCSSRTCFGAHPCALYLHGCTWCVCTPLGLPSFPCVHAVYCVLRPVNGLCVHTHACAVDTPFCVGLCNPRMWYTRD